MKRYLQGIISSATDKVTEVLDERVVAPVGAIITNASDTVAETVDAKVKVPAEIAARTAGKYAVHAVQDAGAALIASAFAPPLGPFVVGLHLLALPAALRDMAEQSTQEVHEERAKARQVKANQAQLPASKAEE